MSTKTKTGSSNRPSHTVYHVTERGEDNTAWTPVGAAWPHKDGKGFTFQIETLPVPFGGRLTVRERKADTSKGQ